MNITEVVSFDKDGRAERFPWLRKLFLSLVIILVAGLSFGIGRLTSTGDRGPVRIEYDQSLSASASASLNTIENSKLKIENSTSVVGSSKGTKYHYAHCPGAKQISEANKITFTSPEAAQASGYTLAGNCRPK